MPTYFVTGATGFIGRHLLERLLEREGDIHVLVREGSQDKLAAVVEQLGGGDRIHAVTGERRAQPAPARVGEREHGLAGAQVLEGGGLPLDGRRAAGVDRDHGDVERVVEAGDPAERDLAVGAPHGDLVAAQHVRVGQHAALADDDARAAAPAAPEPDDGGPDPLAHRCHRGLQLFEETGHMESLASCK
jgi:nucleoside-diphosphate-sugar epimerase